MAPETGVISKEKLYQSRCTARKRCSWILLLKGSMIGMQTMMIFLASWKECSIKELVFSDHCPDPLPAATNWSKWAGWQEMQKILNTISRYLTEIVARILRNESEFCTAYQWKFHKNIVFSRDFLMPEKAVLPIYPSVPSLSGPFSRA